MWACGAPSSTWRKSFFRSISGGPDKAIAFEIEQVEGVKEHAIGPALLERGLKADEARNPGRVLDDDFAVDQRRADLQRAELGRRCSRTSRSNRGPCE